MATTVSIVLVDDLCGSDDDEMVSFGIGGAVCEIDCNVADAAKMRAELGACIVDGRRVRGAPTTRRRGGRCVTRSDPSPVVGRRRREHACPCTRVASVGAGLLAFA